MLYIQSETMIVAVDFISTIQYMIHSFWGNKGSVGNKDGNMNLAVEGNTETTKCYLLMVGEEGAALGLQFLLSVFGKIKIGFLNLLFDAVRYFPVYFRKMCASTTSTAHMSSQILFSVLIEVYFGFAVFFYYLCGFTVTYILQCPPEGRVISRQVEYGTNKERKVGF